MPELRVYNWRTGRVVWCRILNPGFYDFAFVDEHTLLVAQTCRLLVYAIDSSAAGATHSEPIPYTAKLPANVTCLLGLPPLVDNAVASIHGVVSQRPSSSIGHESMFAMDPLRAIIAIPMTVTTPDCAPLEQYLIIVPIGAIITAIKLFNSGKSIKTDEADGSFTLPWQSWGARSLVLPFLHRQGPTNSVTWYCCGLSALGNKCAITFCCNQPYSTIIDTFVVDLVDDATRMDTLIDPGEFLPLSYNVSEDCIPHLLGFPLRNCLSYRLLRKVFEYDHPVDTPWINHSIHLLTDGIVFTVSISLHFQASPAEKIIDIQDV
ncbi:hypothetical protein ACG7TL_007430 [Trametes sanguinea]